MKESQSKKTNIKIEEVNVVTDFNNNRNDVRFVSSCFNAHGLLADRDTHTCFLFQRLLFSLLGLVILSII